LQYGIISLLILGKGEYQMPFVTGLCGGYAVRKKERMRKCGRNEISKRI
jgi:hypothetical protein